MASRRELVSEMANAKIITPADAAALLDNPDDTLIIGQGAAVADASGGATVDTEARTAINDLLTELRSLGVIAT